MNDLELTNDNAPSYRKENPSLFRPPSASQTLRQAIYAQLQANPDVLIPLSQLVFDLRKDYRPIYAACKQLVKHGFATREVRKMALPTKKNPDRMVTYIAVKFVQPWEGKKQSKW